MQLPSGGIEQFGAQPEQEKQTPLALPRGGQSTYTEELGQRICERLCEGESLRKICKDPEFPGRMTVMRWRAEHEEFAKLYAVAIACFAEDTLMECIEIADDASRDFQEKEDPDGMAMVVFNKEAVPRTKLRLDERHLVVGMLAPRRFGANPVIEEYDPTPLRNGDDAKQINPPGNLVRLGNIMVIEDHPLYAPFAVKKDGKAK